MRTYLYIAFGGALGASARFFIKSVLSAQGTAQFPIGTLLVNLSGVLFALFFLTAVEEAVHMDPDRRLFISTGFLGSFTTFSAFCKETVLLFEAEKAGLGFLYFFLTALGEILFAFLGHLLARKTIVKWIWTRRGKAL